MKATWMRGTMAGAVLTFSLACGGEKAAPPPPAATTAPASTVGAPANTAPAATTPAAPGAVGVAECDAYVSKYEACLRDHVPAAQREAMQAAFDQARAAWKQAAVNTESRPSLARACQQAVDVAKLTTTAFGCQW